ncbi:hypothetical protein DL98DRAFT_516002 [Cadophora sp. DSE1049]|nr:hypothetical protein DL98DRAFT_516002 [Cadophora sp. DSE1049]
MSIISILQVAALAIACVNTASAQSSIGDSLPSITQNPSNTTSTLPTYTPSLSSTPPTNITVTPCSTQTALSHSQPIYPVRNTTLSSSHSSPPAVSSKAADVTTKIIVTATADVVPAETRVAPSSTECAGPTCTEFASTASKKERLVEVLGPLAVVAGAFAILL